MGEEKEKEKWRRGGKRREGERRNYERSGEENGSELISVASRVGERIGS